MCVASATTFTLMFKLEVMSSEFNFSVYAYSVKIKEIEFSKIL